MRCRPMVVLPLPADPWIAIRPGRRLGDQLELARIDQRRDRGQVAVRPARAGVVEAQPAARRGRRAAAAAREARGLAAGDDDHRAAVARDLQAGLARRDLAPLPRAQVARERPLRGRDPAQIGIDDRDGPAREHFALDEPVAQALLVGVAFLVAVEEPRHGRVAPVDDLHAAARLDEAARADQNVAALAALLQPQVTEVG